MALSGKDASVDSSKKPRRKRARKRRNDEEATDVFEDERIESIIKEHLARFVKKKQLDEIEMENLTTLVQEFLSCFVLLGYDFKGDPITLVSVENQQQADSIGTLIHRFLTTTRFTPPV
jgi:hypothetical protein